MLLATTCSPQETEALGERIGAVLQSGDILGFTGALGAGKTQLIRGIVRGIAARSGAPSPAVCSPSYTVINTYPLEDLWIYHLDLYRLSSFDDLESTGYWDAVEDPDGISLIEWIEHIPFAAPLAFITVDMGLSRPDDPLSSVRTLDLKSHNAAGLLQRLLELRSPPLV